MVAIGSPEGLVCWDTFKKYHKYLLGLSTLFRIKRFMLDEIVKPKCSKFALFSNTAGITLGKINKVIPFNKRQKKSFYRPIARFGRISLDNFIKNKHLIFEDCLHIYKYKKLKKKNNPPFFFLLCVLIRLNKTRQNFCTSWMSYKHKWKKANTLPIGP